MCVNLPFEDLNLSLYPPHSTSTYTYGVTIAPRVCGGENWSVIGCGSRITQIIRSTRSRSGERAGWVGQGSGLKLVQVKYYKKKKKKKSNFKQVKNKLGQSGCRLDRVDPYFSHEFFFLKKICICDLVNHATNYLVWNTYLGLYSRPISRKSLG